MKVAAESEPAPREGAFPEQGSGRRKERGATGGPHRRPRDRKAVLEARLTRRFAGAMLAQTLAIIGAIAALLRLPG